MTELKIVLDFHGAQLTVSSTQASWVNKIEAMFAPFVAPNANPDLPDFSLVLKHADETVPPLPETPVAYAGPLPDRNEAKVFVHGETTIIALDTGIRTDIRHDLKRATAWLPSLHAKQFFGSCLMTVVDAALFNAGQQLLHAASMVNPADGSAILMCVPSGGGKTTTSLALARRGFALMTDDASVLKPTVDGFEVWGLPRALKVHENTRAMLAWLPDIKSEWDENGEKGYAVDILRDQIAVAEQKPHRLGSVILIGERSISGHNVRSANKAEVLIALAHDNVGIQETGMSRKAQTSFGLMVEALRQARCFTLSAGTDLDNLPEAVTNALAAGNARP